MIRGAHGAKDMLRAKEEAALGGDGEWSFWKASRRRLTGAN